MQSVNSRSARTVGRVMTTNNYYYPFALQVYLQFRVPTYVFIGIRDFPRLALSTVLGTTFEPRVSIQISQRRPYTVYVYRLQYKRSHFCLFSRSPHATYTQYDLYSPSVYITRIVIRCIYAHSTDPVRLSVLLSRHFLELNVCNILIEYYVRARVSVYYMRNEFIIIISRGRITRIVRVREQVDVHNMSTRAPRFAIDLETHIKAKLRI